MVNLNSADAQVIRQTIFLLFVLISSVFAVNNSVRAEEEKPNIPHDPIGRLCKVQIKSEDSKTKIEFTGKIVRLTSKHVVLDHVTRYGTNERGVPFLENVPYTSKLFKNVGIASAPVEGRKKISRKQIVAFEFTEPQVKPAPKVKAPKK